MGGGLPLHPTPNNEENSGDRFCSRQRGSFSAYWEKKINILIFSYFVIYYCAENPLFVYFPTRPRTRPRHTFTKSEGGINPSSSHSPTLFWNFSFPFLREIYVNILFVNRKRGPLVTILTKKICQFTHLPLTDYWRLEKFFLSPHLLNGLYVCMYVCFFTRPFSFFHSDPELVNWDWSRLFNVLKKRYMLAGFVKSYCTSKRRLNRSWKMVLGVFFSRRDGHCPSKIRPLYYSTPGLLHTKSIRSASRLITLYLFFFFFFKIRKRTIN